MPLPLLLLTRPEAQSRAFAARLTGAPPHEVLIAPVSEIVPLVWDRALARGVRGVVLTSANAVPALAGVPGLAGLPAFCVGEQTARAAARAGLAAQAGGGDAVALAGWLRALGPEGPLLHPHGLHLAHDMAAALAASGIAVRSAAVYEARDRPWPADLPGRLAGRRVLAPAFSPRAAAELAARLPDPPPGLQVVAISPAAAARLSPRLAAGVTVAPRPGAMAETVAALLGGQA